MASYRKEEDLLGARDLPIDVLHGIHTVRALENFPLAGRPVDPALVSAYGYVKLACAMTNRGLGIWKNEGKADAIEQACREMAEGRLDEFIIVDQSPGWGWDLDQYECE